MHIGSGPGVAGLSGMQVQPLLPSRRVAIDPSASACMMVASREMDSGAADIALATGSLASEGAASLLETAAASLSPPRSQPAKARHAVAVRKLMNTLLFREVIASSITVS